MSIIRNGADYVEISGDGITQRIIETKKLFKYGLETGQLLEDDKLYFS